LAALACVICSSATPPGEQIAGHEPPDRGVEEDEVGVVGGAADECRDGYDDHRGDDGEGYQGRDVEKVEHHNNKQ